MNTPMVAPRAVLAAMGEVLGREAAPHELYNAAAAGRVRKQNIGPRRYHFALADAEAEARAIKEREESRVAGDEQRPAGPLLTSAEALTRMHAAGLGVNRSKFYKLGLPVAWMSRDGNPAYYYRPADVDAKIDELLAERDGLLSTRQAVAWINREYPALGRPLTPDGFYHWIHRGLVTPTDRVDHGTWSEYRFSEEALRAAAPIRNLERSAVLTGPVPVITTTEELLALQEKYGPLVTARGAREIAAKRGAAISTAAIKARKQRGTLIPVARMGNALLFAALDVKPGRAPMRAALA